MNQPQLRLGVATTGTKVSNVPGSSLEYVTPEHTTQNNVSHERVFFHHPVNGHSSQENIFEYIKHEIARSSRYLSNGQRIGEGVVALFDYDGTLAAAGLPHSQTRPDAGIVTGLKRLLSSGAEVVLVSGKDVAGLRSLINIDGLKYSGLFGLEYDLGDGEVRYHPKVTEAHTHAVAQVYEILKDRFIDGDLHVEGLELEHQGSLMQKTDFGTEVHQRMLVTTLVWKACENIDVEPITDRISSIAREFGLEVNIGHGYINVLPFFPGKTGAVNDLLGIEEIRSDDNILEFVVSSDSQEKTVIFVGDEKPDADAFQHLTQLKDEGLIAGCVNLGVSHPEYIKKVDVVFDLFNPDAVRIFHVDSNGDMELKRNCPKENSVVMIQSDKHSVDTSLELPLELDKHNHMIVPGPKGVSHLIFRMSQLFHVEVGQESQRCTPRDVPSRVLTSTLGSKDILQI